MAICLKEEEQVMADILSPSSVALKERGLGRIRHCGSLCDVGAGLAVSGRVTVCCVALLRHNELNDI